MLVFQYYSDRINHIFIILMNRHLFKFKQENLFFRLFGRLLQSKIVLSLRRWLMRFSPFLRLESQATDTVYMSWLVDIELVRQRFPEPIRLWEHQGKTIFSILFYHHHHFGLHCLGPARKIFPSPHQSNWRFYLAEELLPKTVIFEQIVVDKMLHVMGGRILSDAMPAQYDPNFKHQVQRSEGELKIHAKINMDERYCLDVKLKNIQDQQLTGAWAEIFPNWEDALKFFVPQEHVWVECVDQSEKLSQGNIEIVSDFQQIRPLTIEQIDCPLLSELGIDTDSQPLCFFIPNLDFHVLGENPVEKKYSIGEGHESTPF